MFRIFFLLSTFFCFFSFLPVHGMRNLVRRNTVYALDSLNEARQGLHEVVREAESCCDSCVSLCEICNPSKNSYPIRTSSCCCGFSFVFGSVFFGLFYFFTKLNDWPSKTEAIAILQTVVAQNETISEFCKKLVGQ